MKLVDLSEDVSDQDDAYKLGYEHAKAGLDRNPYSPNDYRYFRYARGKRGAYMQKRNKQKRHTTPKHQAKTTAAVRSIKKFRKWKIGKKYFNKKD